MDGIAVSMQPAGFQLEKMQSVRVILERLSVAQKNASVLRGNLQTAFEFIVANLCGQEMLLMLRNKWGLSKKDAQKLYYDVRNKGNETEEENKESPRPDTIDKKISMIMDYMKETSSKLDSIDRDIADLKKQVEEILRRI